MSHPLDGHWISCLLVELLLNGPHNPTPVGKCPLTYCNSPELTKEDTLPDNYPGWKVTPTGLLQPTKSE